MNLNALFNVLLDLLRLGSKIPVMSVKYSNLY